MSKRITQVIPANTLSENAYRVLQGMYLRSAVTYWQYTDTPMDILFIGD